MPSASRILPSVFRFLASLKLAVMLLATLALVLAGSLDEAEAAASNRSAAAPGFGAFGDFFAKAKK